MPGMDGLEAARRIRALPGTRQTLLVAVTGWGQERDRQQTSEAGFDAHLVKPADPFALRSLIARAPAATSAWRGRTRACAQARLPAATSSTTPAARLSPPTIGGSGIRSCFSAVAWMGPMSITFSCRV